MRKYLLLTVFGLALLTSIAARADDYMLILKDHQFSPLQITVPAGQKVKLIVQNQDPAPAEFESSDLDREKVVSGNSQIVVFIGPLNVGSYSYFDDFHRETTGTIIAK